MKITVLAFFAAVAATGAFAETAQPVSYNEWVETNTHAIKCPRPGVDAEAFVNWSNNFPAS